MRGNFNLASLLLPITELRLIYKYYKDCKRIDRTDKKSTKNFIIKNYSNKCRIAEYYTCQY